MLRIKPATVMVADAVVYAFGKNREGYSNTEAEAFKKQRVERNERRWWIV